MIITYEIDDGYAGKSRPQTVEVSDDEILECDSVDEIKDLINEYVVEDFQCRIYPVADIEEVLDFWKKENGDE